MATEHRKRQPRGFSDKRAINLYNPELGRSFFVNGKPLIRGTTAWDDREDVRVECGACLVSYGSLDASQSTYGVSSLSRNSTARIRKKLIQEKKNVEIYGLPDWAILPTVPT